MEQRFKNREEAGRELAAVLKENYAGRDDVLVLGLPRGGVPVANEVARALSLPMDVWLVRKLGVPGQEELAMGAIALGGVSYINRDLVRQLGIAETAVEHVIAREQSELERRNNLYRGDAPAPEVVDKTVIAVDDGLATGATMRAAAMALREAGAAKVVIAVPVGAAETCRELEQDFDELVCMYRMEPFFAVGQWYEDFGQTSDKDVQELLAPYAGSYGKGRSSEMRSSGL